MALYETNLIGGRVCEALVVEDIIAVNSEILQNGRLFGDDFVVEIAFVTFLPNGQRRDSVLLHGCQSSANCAYP